MDSSEQSGEDVSVKLSRIRLATGEHMVTSKQVSPHAFSVVEVDFANVDAARSSVKGALEGARGVQPHLPAVHLPRRGQRAT